MTTLYCAVSTKSFESMPRLGSAVKVRHTQRRLGAGATANGHPHAAWATAVIQCPLERTPSHHRASGAAVPNIEGQWSRHNVLPRAD
jgi:hypothetical protein